MLCRSFSGDIGMEFDVDNCSVLVLKHGAKVHCEGIVLPDDQGIGEVDENGYKYLEVLESADIMQKKIKGRSGRIGVSKEGEAGGKVEIMWCEFY